MKYHSNKKAFIIEGFLGDCRFTPFSHEIVRISNPLLEKHLPNFRIDLLEIPGTSYHDAKLRYTFRLDEHENLWEYYFECLARLKQKVDVKFVLTSEGFGQELSLGLESIREALANFLMHTDYFSPGNPRIRIFNDHIEFYNPGGFPKPYDELRKKDISLPRNPLTAKMFRMVKLAENAGFGFEKIEKNWQSYNQTTPEYQIEFDSIVLKMPMQKSSEKSSEKILKLVAANKIITINELSEKIGISTRAIEKQIKKLQKEKKLLRHGADKGGYWEVID